MFFKLGFELKVWQQKKLKKIMYAKITHFEIIVDLRIWDFFENPDMAHVQSAVKHWKIDEISKFQKNSKI